MKNRELISQLQNYSPEAEVGFYRYSGVVGLVFQSIISITNDIEDKDRIGIELGQPIPIDK